jgi:phosphoglycerol transferase MdoB-like AlkP superfamily enzyme
MFGITTSVVDVTRFKTSSRNPLVVDQRVIANDFIGYDKFYFLGGSANWANIRAVFANNIKGLKVIEEKDHKSKRVDVWGISDLDLLKEAADRLVLEKKPFLATIQLAGFHRPYTIPEDRGDFRLLDKSVDYKRAGFNSIEQLNSIRFSDYALGEFFKKVKQSSLIENTLFVITGDHGIPDEGGVNISKAYHIHGLERYHVPLVLFAPKILEPKEDQRIASEIDIMPTVASLVGIEHKLTTLGRDLMETKYDKSRVAFIFDSYAPKVSYSLLSDEFYYKMRNKDKEELFLFKDGAEPGIDVKTQYPEVFKKLSSLAHAFYEANRYFLYKNKKPKLESGPK